MKALIPLTKIGFFNPGRLTDQEIEDAFVARIPFFNYLFEKITSEKPGSIPQQYLVIGQRGMGKSSLLMRIAAELRKSKYQSLFIPLSFPEEQYNVDRLSKFWLNCLDAIADELDKEGNSVYLDEFDVEIRKLSKETALNANLVYETFEKWIEKIGRRPVLLVDNLDLIFSKITKEEQHQLRAILMSKGAPILVGASATPVDETLDYQAPFYDAFQISYLKKLSFSESLDVLLNLASITGNDDFQYEVHQQKGRLEALYQLTGGTPRTLTILFPLIQNGFSDDIQTDLDALLDLITPLYKARFEELPSQLQVILDAVALNWDPMNLQKLRDVTMLDNAQLSPQLKRLVDIGWLQRLDAYKAKGGAYELSERFFNVWYLMRRSSRRQKRELYCLTKFLESFYGNALHEIAQSRIDSKSDNVDHITLDLALADAMKDKDLREKLRKKGFEALVSISISNMDILQQFAIPDEINEELIQKHFSQAIELAKEDKDEEAENCLLQILKFNPANSKIWTYLGLFRLFLFKKYDEANEALQKAVTLNAENPSAWNAIGNLYKDHYKEYTQAEIAYRKAIQPDRNYTSPLIGLAELYTDHLQKYEEAELLLQNAISLDDSDDEPYRLLGGLYMFHLDRYEQAERALKKAIELNDKEFLNWYMLGDLYKSSRLNRIEEAEAAYKKGIEREEEPYIGYYNLGVLYCYDMEAYEKAEEAYLQAIGINGGVDYIWNTLGSLYALYLFDYKKAESAFIKAAELDPNNESSLIGLGNLYIKSPETLDKAEYMLKRAIELSPKSEFAWTSLGNLYGDYLNRFSDAEKAYLKAIAIDKNSSYLWNKIGNLYTEYLIDYKKAESAYQKAVKISPNDALVWGNLGHLYCQHMAQYQKAKEAYEKGLKQDPVNYEIWNALGNIYSDFLDQFDEAQNAYRQCININPENEFAKYNLVFLLRDRMGDIDNARDVFKEISETDELKDSYLLNKSLFAYYDNNIGYAETYLKEALSVIGDGLPAVTKDDWYRAIAVIIKLGFGERLIKLLRDLGYDIILRPLFVAMEALVIFKDPNYLDSIAAEIREPAKQIMVILKTFTK